MRKLTHLGENVWLDLTKVIAVHTISDFGPGYRLWIPPFNESVFQERQPVAYAFVEKWLRRNSEWVGDDGKRRTACVTCDTEMEIQGDTARCPKCAIIFGV